MVSFGKGKVAIKLSERVNAGPALASELETGPISLSSLTRFSLVWLTESTVSALNSASRSSASKRFSRWPAAPRARRESFERWSTTGFWAANFPTRSLRLSVAAMMSPVWSLRLPDEQVELLEQAAQILLAAAKRGGERLDDVLDLTNAAAVEHQRQRGKGLLGGREGAAA